MSRRTHVDPRAPGFGFVFDPGPGSSRGYWVGRVSSGSLDTSEFDLLQVSTRSDAAALCLLLAGLHPSVVDQLVVSVIRPVYQSFHLTPFDVSDMSLLCRVVLGFFERGQRP